MSPIYLKPILLGAFITLLLACNNSQGQRKTTKDVDMALHYIERQPLVKTSKPRLLILMHGRGSNERDLFSFADRLPADFLVLSVHAPYKIGEDAYQWFETDFSTGKPECNAIQAKASVDLMVQFIAQVKARYQFDTTQIYLCGFSQGAIMSYCLAATIPEQLKGIAVMSGRVLNEFKAINVPGDRFKHLRVFISHGVSDHLIDIQYAHDGKAWIEQLGITPYYKEYPVGHNISIDMLNDLVKWFGE